jgi:hypothetical protein
MRRGGVRWAALGAVLLAVTLAAGCQGGAASPGLATSSDPSAAATASASPSPTAPPVDPAATTEACGLAAAATQTTTAIFNDQIAALEQAAAHNDQAAMVAAAEAINQQFVSLGSTFTQLAKRRISPELRTVLTDISTALEEMSSLAYTGTTVDIRRKLLDFSAAISGTCTPPSSAPAGLR